MINFSNRKTPGSFHDVNRKLGKFCGSFLDEIEVSKKNIEMVPSGATIRLEYVKCGKYNCTTCYEEDYSEIYHGPYYYAYWRDKENNGKLKKKYIGIHYPLNNPKNRIE